MKHVLVLGLLFIFVLGCSDSVKKDSQSNNASNNASSDAGSDGEPNNVTCEPFEVESNGVCERTNIISVQALTSAYEDAPLDLFSVFTTPSDWEFSRPSLRREAGCDTFDPDIEVTFSDLLLDAGEIVITTPEREFLFLPDEDLDAYVVDDRPDPTDWFDPAFEAQIELEGGEDFPAFQSSFSIYTYPEILVAPRFDLSRGYAVEWGSRDADFATVELRFTFVDGRRGRVQCRVSDSGTYEIPADAIEPLFPGEVAGIRVVVRQTTNSYHRQNNGATIEVRSSNSRFVNVLFD